LSRGRRNFIEEHNGVKDTQQRIDLVNGYLEGIMSIANTICNYLDNNEPRKGVNTRIKALSNSIDTLALAAMETLPDFTGAESY
jgi:hypothetical protein